MLSFVFYIHDNLRFFLKCIPYFRTEYYVTRLISFSRIFRLRGIDDHGHADDLVRGGARFSDPERGRPGHGGGPLLLQATRRNPKASP